MKVHRRFLTVLLAVLLASAGCSGSENDTAEATPLASASAVADAEPSPTVTEVAAPEATDEQRIAAALDQLAIDVAGDEAISPSIDSLIAYDVLDTTVNPETGDVTITICGWPEGTVFDTVRNSLYSIKTNPDGTVTATHRTSPTGPGDCLNTELINTALDHIDEYDIYWDGILADPASFERGPATSGLLAEQSVVRSEKLTSDWVRDELQLVRPFKTDGSARTQAVRDILYARYFVGDLEVLDIVVCREMNPTSGTYRNGALLDDGRTPDDPGLHAITSYQLIPANVGSQGWRISGTNGLVWSDCVATDDWPAAVTLWRPLDEPFQAIES